MNIINCKEIRAEMLTEAKVELTKIYALTGRVLKLTVVQVDGDAASDVYIRNKIKTCEDVGIVCDHIKLPNDISVEKLVAVIEDLSYSPLCTGVMLQLPLPDHLKPHQQMLLDLIPWYKDVDGLGTDNVGRLWTGQECITPATAQGVMRLLPNDLSGKNVTILGRSNLVGKPLIKLLLDRNATVEVCHSKTSSLNWHTISSNIVISAIGKPKYIKGNCVNSAQTFIDVGINRDEHGKLCGDLDIDSLREWGHKYCNITPVPGGVGLLTTAQLVLNVVKAYCLQKR